MEHIAPLILLRLIKRPIIGDKSFSGERNPYKHQDQKPQPTGVETFGNEIDSNTITHEQKQRQIQKPN
jgi:hypothetical protein